MMGEKTATFAAGCFWGPEARFRELEGVLDAEVGYTGGTVDDPDYRSVCAGDTGHAEAVRLTYDPERIGYDELLEAFWRMHDPTQRNRQGPDMGSQYRSAIFTHDAEQQEAAERSKRGLEASGRFDAPIATEIRPAGPFWRAEEYHQRYLEKSGR
ncbi:MAG: peptide-methionine (S)-S-oxide reductase MsrA [Wenzhouxiangellaceae bacterium]|nr:peptide-methionine (S)-S-oxide reductase MsrA [Wenzhouxiangellaceae bacterium]MBS3746166.1 peptide-methionine (S)-S-oxide reductase MsrA [Wenzhouxiangellaceae bacterium]MBS3822622.1 peptide-methionine (S)-S-oxide reductase MsrA [Wenzhouxiangellaceae bacterium]